MAGKDQDSGPEVAVRRLQLERAEGFSRVLKIGALTATAVMVLDATMFIQTGNRSYLIFSMLAALVLPTVVYGLLALQGGRLDRAVAVPLVYVLLIAPIGPALVESRALVSIALPFIGMAVAMNYAQQRHLSGYTIGSWLSGTTVLGLWQWNMAHSLDLDPRFAIGNVVTASIILGFAVYAMSHYSRRLHRAFEDARGAHDDLEEAHIELREVDAARVRFMNNAAHELKTPITPISIQLQLLRRSSLGREDDRAKRSIEILDRNFTRLQRLIGDILDGARMDAGKLEIHTAPLDLSDTLEEATDEYRHAAEMSGIRLEHRIEHGLLIEGDGLRIRQVVDNLLTNALKFTSPGGSVSLEALAVDGNACVNIQDTGTGIAPQDIPKLFQPFRQVHDPMKTVTGGSGLGLFISRGIVERHGGLIWAESPGLGEGATFSFCIPLRKAVLPTVEDDQEPVEPMAEKTQPPE